MILDQNSNIVDREWMLGQNSLAVDFMLQGDYGKAMTVFHTAFSQLASQLPSRTMEPAYSCSIIAHDTELSSVQNSCYEVISLGFTGTPPSIKDEDNIDKHHGSWIPDHNVFAIYGYAFRGAKPTAAGCSRHICPLLRAMTPAMVLYNNALTVQLQALKNPMGQCVALEKALRLYEMAWCELSAEHHQRPPSGPTDRCDFGLYMHLLLAIINNIGSIYYHCFHMHGVRHSLSELRRALMHISLWEECCILKESLVHFRLNVVLLAGDYVLGAPAA